MNKLEQFLLEAKDDYTSDEAGYKEEVKPVPKVCGTCHFLGIDYDDIRYCNIIIPTDNENYYPDFKGRDRLQVSDFSVCKLWKKHKNY